MKEEHTTYFLGIAVAMCGLFFYMLCRYLSPSARRKRNLAKPASRQRSNSIGLSRLMHSRLLNEEYDSVISLFAHFESTEVGGAPMNKETVAKIFYPTLSQYRNFRCAPRFTHPVSPIFALPDIEWVEPPKGSSFDFDYHFQQHDFSSNEEMEKWVTHKSNQINELRVNSNGVRPWYDVHVMNVKGAKSPEGKTVSHAMVRIHHCIGDGISLVQAFSGVMKDGGGNPADLSSLFNPGGSRGGDRKKKVSLLSHLGRVLLVPFMTASFVKHVFMCLWAPAIWHDTATVFHTPTEGRDTNLKEAAPRIRCFMPSHKVAFVKEIKKRVSEKVKKPVTVNDVEYSLLAGAVRRYIQKVGGKNDAELEKMLMRVLTPLALPVKLKPGEDKHTLGLRNYFAMMNTILPIGAKSALDRVMSSNSVWNHVKTSMMIPAYFIAVEISSWLPFMLQQWVLRNYYSSVAFCFSNVPGPSFPIFVAGHKLTGAHMMIPNGPAMIGIFSCDGYLHQVTTMMQGGSAKNPVNVGKEEEVLSACFMEELEELAGSVGFSPAEVKAAVKAKYH